MMLNTLIDNAAAQGAIIDERITFEKTEDSGISAFLKPNSLTIDPIVIEIPNSMIIKPDDAYRAFNLEAELIGNYEDLIFKIYIAGLLSGRVKNEYFEPYIMLLPHPSEIGSPLTMSDEELKLFKDTSLQIKFIKERKHSLKDQFELVRSYIEGITFDEFLWAHLIITSRAFPYKIINPNSKPNLVMLLPIIDLLNHRPNSKVEWSSDSSGNFRLSALLPPSTDLQRIEVFNNYGPKGNAELFMGYGFVLEDNEYETLQLSLSLPHKLKSDLKNQWNIRLPTIDDYTFLVDQNSDHRDETDKLEEASDITVFMLNKFHPIATGLLEVFAFVCRNEGDEGLTLKNTLNGLNQLKKSLELKFLNKLDKMPVLDTTKVSSEIYAKAVIFRKGQLKVYNMAKSEIKAREKQLLKEYRQYLITIKDIYKNESEEFGNFMKIMEWDKDISHLTKMDMELIFRLWLLKAINYRRSGNAQNSKFDLNWLFDLFEQKYQSFDVGNSEEYMIKLYSQIMSKIKKNASEVMKGNHWELKDWLIVDNIVTENSYEKGKSLEPILIGPLNLF